MTYSVVLEPMCVPPRRERNRRGAHPSAEGLCCVSIHAARARKDLFDAKGWLRTEALRSSAFFFFSQNALDGDETRRTRRDETKHARTCLSRRREGGTRACRASKRVSAFPSRCLSSVAPRAIPPSANLKKKRLVCDVYALARTSSTNCPSLPSGPPFPSTRCSPVAILL